MEFTEITNIVGANSASGSLGFGFPVGPHPASAISTGTASGTIGGATTFTIPVLDTQDFYEGLLNDIQPSLLGYYLQTPFISKELLLNLLVERIVVHVTDGACAQSHLTTCERNLRNNPYTPEDIALFQTFVTYLLTLQVSAEPVKAKEKPSTTTTTHAGSTTVNVTNGTPASSDSSAAAAPKASPYRLCFSPRTLGQAVPLSAECGNTEPNGTDLKIAPSTKVDGILFSPVLANAMLDVIAQLKDGPPCSEQNEIQRPAHDSSCFEESIRAFSGRRVAITLQFRSTGSIFNFLGQLVSEEQAGRSLPLYPKPRFNPRPHDWPPCWVNLSGPYKPIISVRADGAPTLVSVGYAGSLYAVPGDPNFSYSPDVFTILKQLVALNLSAKNLPTTAILSVTNP